MSYYFVIVGTQDNPLFEHEFGTSKAGGDGQARFPENARHMNQFVVHSSLDIVEEIQWGTGQMYLKCVDRFYNNYISTFLTPTNVKFMLLHQPPNTTPNTPLPSNQLNANPQRSSTSAIAANPTSPQTEEAVRAFMLEVYESWVKAVMSPFYRANMEIRSPVFRQRVAAAGRKYL